MDKVRTSTRLARAQARKQDDLVISAASAPGGYRPWPGPEQVAPFGLLVAASGGQLWERALRASVASGVEHCC